MGMLKDGSELISELKQVIKVLQIGYRKHGMDHRISNLSGKVKSKGKSTSDKFYKWVYNAGAWIKKEMVK